MEISPTNTSAAGASRASATKDAVEGAETGAGATDFQTFLTLLTTQLRNQDPLKPMESTEFVAQLASFSGVEQQIRTNDRLDQIAAALGGGAASGLADWIGREVRAPAEANFTGVPVEIATEVLADADAATLVVRNDFGQAVARRGLDPTAETYSWDGRDELGQSLPHGLYGFEVESLKDGAAIGATAGQVFGTVVEARIEDGAATLVLEGGARVPLDEIGAVR